MSALPWVLLFAWVARRLLGARRVGARRVLLAGFAGYALGLVFAFVLTPGPPHGAFVWLGSALAVVFTMVAIVGFELVADRGGPLVPPGLPHVPHPLRRLRLGLSVVLRFVEVSRIISRHGLGPVLGLRGAVSAGEPEALARRVCEALEEAGGVFVKLGQLLSTRLDLVPPAAAAEFARLQDDVAPVDAAVVSALLTQELDAPVADAFADLDLEPLGSASIAQAHRARLRDGTDVVVKIQRPGVAEMIERDLRIMRWLARSAERHTRWGARFGVVAATEDFAARLREELDFRVEARNALEIAQGLADVPAVHVPRVHPQWTTVRVLVMERLDGVGLGQGAGNVPEADRRVLAETLLRTELVPMLRGDRFHGDPHPGNVFLLPDGRLALIDFGASGRLNAFERASITQMLLAIRDQDPTLLREALLDVATPPEGADLRRLDRALAAFLARHLGSGLDAPDADMFADLLGVLGSAGITLPASTTAMFRALVTLQGTLEVLCPGFPLVAAAEKLGAGLVSRFPSDVGAQDGAAITTAALRALVEKELVMALPVLRRAPRRLDRLAELAENGELRSQVRLFADPRDTAVLTRLVSRIVLAGLGGVIGLTSALLLMAGRGPRLLEGLTLLDVLGYLGLAGGLVLVLRVTLAALRDGG